MTNEEAIIVLECIAVDYTGLLVGLSVTDPFNDVLEQRIKAINMAQEALRRTHERIHN